MTDATEPAMRPDAASRAEEVRDSQVPSGADRPPTAEEAAVADQLEPDADVAEHEREMAERGAQQQGEGRIA